MHATSGFASVAWLTQRDRWVMRGISGGRERAGRGNGASTMARLLVVMGIADLLCGE